MRIFFLLTLLLYAVDGQKTCVQYSDSTNCDTLSNGACRWIGGIGGDCRCASEVKLDILFGVDSSGSIGSSNFEIQRQFLNDLVTRGVANESRVGFLPFSTDVYTSDLSDSTTVNYYRRESWLGQLPIDFWDEDELHQYVDNLVWVAQWTNTPQLIDDALTEFDNLPDKSGRQSVFIILTDGNPCLASGCGFSVCGYAPELKRKGIRTIIIAVGSNLDKSKMDCILEKKDEDWLSVTGFTEQAFQSIMSSLSLVLCPITKRCKLTEIKPMRKPPAWSNAGDGRFTRFIEIWNDGVDFSLQTLLLEGFVSFDGSTAGVPDINIPQSSYVVFYDASDLPGDGSNPSVPTCHVCTEECDLTGCANAMNSISEDNCFCGEAIYVACSSSPTPDTTCPITNSLNSDNGHTAYDLCGYCSFNNNMDKTNWNVVIKDVDAVDPIDTVYYGAEGFWMTLPDKFSYELISRGYNNDNGNNWAWSCNQFGTPGAPPSASCDKTCITQGGTCGDSGICQGSGVCLCDQSLGYYPICDSSTGICHTCAEVPSIDECTVQWLKNNSHPTNRKYAMYTWSDSGYDGHLRYRLNYVREGGATQEAFTLGELVYNTSDYNTENSTYGGYVQTEIQVCEDYDLQLNCFIYYSTATRCWISTSAPTLAPSFSPSSAPTAYPTGEPTQQPTWECPRYYWTGGTSEEICAYGNNEVCYDDDSITDGKCPRCSCFEGGKQCCLLLPDFETVYDINRQHKDTFDCKLDVELAEPQDRNEGSEKAGISNGYLLTVNTHDFAVGITPVDFPCVMDIYWQLEFDEIKCSGEEDTCDESAAATVEAAGLAIDVTGGWLKVWGANDVSNATIQFTISRMDCDDCDSFESLTLLGNLVIVNATAECYVDCEDGRIFPMRIPVWYNYASAFTVPPSQESELPAWLWWLVAALVVFLGLLAFLLYRYWWKNKKVGAALSGVQDDLDAAVTEQEQGFGAGISGNAVGFNPLATGFNPNAAAGAVGPNAPPGGGGGGGDFVRPNVEKQVFRQEYGQQAGNQEMGKFN